MLSFAEESVQFQCRYSRTVNTDATFEIVPTFQPQPVIGYGQLSYEMNVVAGDLGGNTIVTISPNHSFEDQIAVRFKLISLDFI